MHCQGRLRRAISALATVLFVAPTLGLAAPAGASALNKHDVGGRHTHEAIAATGGLEQDGYWVVNRGGGVGAAGGAPDLGGLPRSLTLSDPVVDMAATPHGRGYWLVTAGGKVFGFGDAALLGRATPGQVRADGQVVAMAATRDGKGYWLLTAHGRVLNFGDAHSYGSLSGAQLVAADLGLAGITATPEGGGYWVTASNGKVFCFGDALCFTRELAQVPHVVGLAPTPGGRGYWLATASGKVLAYGNAAPAHGARLAPPGQPVVSIASAPRGTGFWLATSPGSTFGAGPMVHSQADNLASSAVAIAADPQPVLPGPDVAAGPGAHVLGSAVATSAGDRAVRFALAQVGKPYVWGATGPGSYDCSGLALASWRSAGIALPRTAAEQYYAGAHVPLSQLQPGDLLFWASDPADPATIFHVAISLGGDETVQATHTGSTVMVMPIWPQDLVPVATVP